jgi:drug/metabolite transporter (DMT)-like permease
MRRTWLALALAFVGVASVSAPQTAQAYCVGCAVGAGAIGGLAAGAIIGSAIAAPPPYYGPGPYYAAPPGPGCYYTRQPVWDPMIGAYRRGPRVLVCP